MPSISCGGDSPLESDLAPVPNAASRRPNSASGTSSSTAANAAGFDAKLRALSARLGMPVAAAKASEQQQSTLSFSSASASSVLHGGFVDPSSFLSTSSPNQRGAEDDAGGERSVAELAAALMHEFEDIGSYRFDEEEERKRLRQEDHRDRVDKARQQREQQRQTRRQSRAQHADGHHQDDGTTSSMVASVPFFNAGAAPSVCSAVTTTSTVRLRRDELYELPPELANNGGAMRRRFIGQRATAGYTKMLSAAAGTNVGSSGSVSRRGGTTAASQPLLERIPTSSPPQPSRRRTDSSSRATSFATMTPSVLDAPHAAAAPPPSSTVTAAAATLVDDDDAEDEEEEPDVFVDDGAIGFCSCGKVAERDPQRGGALCCRTCGPLQPLSAVAHAAEVQCDDDDVVGSLPGARAVADDATEQRRAARAAKPSATGETTSVDDEEEQHRLFRKAVAEWRRAGNSNGKQLDDEEGDDVTAAVDAASAEDISFRHDLRRPDPSRFMYFSQLWQRVQALEDC
jgi:hypothetical protein